MERIQQRIYLSRRSRNSVEFEHNILRIPLRLGDETSFEMRIINSGEPTHVHFSLSTDMADKVMILQDKVYVIDEEKIAAIVRLPKSYAGAIEDMEAGEISVSTGYGATKKSFSVSIVEREQEKKLQIEDRADEGAEIEETAEKKEKVVVRELAVSPERMALLRRLTVSTVAIALFLISFCIVSTSFHPFVFALIASALFIFIVVYNL